jgi:starch synthase
MPGMTPADDVQDAETLAATDDAAAADRRLTVSILTREYPPSIYGGAGVHVAQLVPQLQKLIDVDVQCMGEPRPGATAHAESYPEGANAAIRVFGADLSMVAAVPEVDVVHSHTWYANLGGLLTGLYQDIPHVVTAHSLEPHRPWKAEQLAGGYRLSSWAERTAFEAADAVIAVSEGMKAGILDSYTDLDPARLHVVKNGIDTDEFAPDKGTDVVESIGMALDKPTVVFVGRITRQKGLIHLVRAAEQFDPGTQLVLLAGAPDTPEIAREVGDAFAHLQESRGNVIWIEEMLPRASVRQVLSHATVFACPSVYEPLGIVNLEAMACETAVVASAVGGIPEVVVDGETGYLVPYDPAQADDPEFVRRFEADFAAKVNALTSDPGQAHDFGLAGRQRCVDEFSWAKIAAETVDVYRAAIAAHGSR